MASPQVHHSSAKAASGPSSAGFKPCTLTWYDPALGGINSSHGQADPHARTASGEPYDPNQYTCAASPQYPFGTIITIMRNSTVINVKVNDRGGAVQGNHFDLSRHAAEVLGVISAGRATGLFKVASKGGGGGINLGPLVPGIQNPLGPNLPGTNIPGQTPPVPNPLADVLKPIAAFFKFMISLWYPSTWVRIGKAIFGFFLIMWGVHSLLKSQGVDVVKGAKRAAIKTAEAAAIVK